MRKNLLALSIAATIGSLAGTANAAVFLNTASGLGTSGIPAAAATLTPTTTGVGHLLLVPYYTAQAGKVSLLNLVNTDNNNGKAVKLRYRGASNSDDVFDITIYLSPSDAWTGSVDIDSTGVARLQTSDTSCTLPSKQDIKDAGGKFKTNRVRSSSAAQTLEGYVEILNTADVPRFLSKPDGTPSATANPLYNAIVHASGTPTCASAVMDLQENPLVDATPLADPTTNANSWNVRGYTYPTGGLFANWTIADLGKKSVTTGEATALRATPSGVIDQSGSANLVWFPQTTANLGIGATANAWTADPLLQTVAPATAPIVRPAMYDFPDLSTPYVSASATPEAQVNTLAARLQVTRVVNEFLTSGTATSGTDFATDWVFSMPTRRYAMAVNYASATTPIVRNTGITAHYTTANTVYDSTKGQICVDSGALRAWDREESTRSTFVISPDTAIRFCGEVSVLTFNNKASVLGAQVAVNAVDTKYTDGWFSIMTPGATGVGLPVIGYATAGYASGALGGTWNHRTSNLVGGGH